MNITYQEMIINDFDGVYALWKKTPGVGLRSVDDTPEGIGRFLKHNPGTNFIAKDGDKIIGVILCGTDGRRAYIYHTVVDSDYRGNGIGRKLAELCIDSVKKLGITRMALVAFKNNEIGNGFWEHIGFVTREDLLYKNLSLNDKNI